MKSRKLMTGFGHVTRTTLCVLIGYISTGCVSATTRQERMSIALAQTIQDMLPTVGAIGSSFDPKIVRYPPKVSVSDGMNRLRSLLGEGADPTIVRIEGYAPEHHYRTPGFTSESTGSKGAITLYSKGGVALDEYCTIHQLYEAADLLSGHGTASHSDKPLLSGRLLDEDGAALANAWFRLEVGIPDPRGSPSKTQMAARSDSEGSFLVKLHGKVEVDARVSFRFLYPHTAEPMTQADVGVAVVDVARIALGDVRLRRIE